VDAWHLSLVSWGAVVGKEKCFDVQMEFGILNAPPVLLPEPLHDGNSKFEIRNSKGRDWGSD
jgi:hypothetical protein